MFVNQNRDFNLNEYFCCDFTKFVFAMCFFIVYFFSAIYIPVYCQLFAILITASTQS